MAQPGTVISLQVLTAHGQRPRSLAEVRGLVGQGLDGDLHGKTTPGGSRQVLILDRQTLDAFGLRPGDLREQITVDFAPLQTLPAGARLRIGEVTFELTGPCAPCTHIGGLNQVADAAAFQRELDGRRGQLARVVAVEGQGVVRVGDPVLAAVRA